MEWRRLTQPEEPAFGRAMALYEASFPRHEQRLPDEQRAVLSHRGETAMEWRRLTQPEEPAFGRAMALYEASFPRHEQRLPDEQRAVLSHPEYHFIQLFDGAEFVGLLLYWEAEDFRYVEHFCVRPELRGRRYGAKALEELGRDGKTVVLEIDPPVDDIARRRQGFYQRCGFAVNPYPHVHPPYRPEYPGHELVVLSSPRALTPAEYGAFACYLSAVVMA